MFNKYYIVSYSGYEDYSPTIVYGPKQDNWELYCRKLLPQAEQQALHACPDGLIGWPELVVALIKILQDNGYQIVELEDTNFSGTRIIDKEAHGIGVLTHNGIKQIITHNKKIANEYNI